MQNLPRVKQRLVGEVTPPDLNDPAKIRRILAKDIRPERRQELEQRLKVLTNG